MKMGYTGLGTRGQPHGCMQGVPDKIELKGLVA